MYKVVPKILIPYAHRLLGQLNDECWNCRALSFYLNYTGPQWQTSMIIS